MTRDPAPRTPRSNRDPGTRGRRAPRLAYRLDLKSEQGVTLGSTPLLAGSDAEAIHLAMRRLHQVAMVELWRRTRWVCRIEWGPVAARSVP
jgi:hypothetical protein